MLFAPFLGMLVDHYCSVDNGGCDDECLPDTLEGAAVSPLFNYTCACNDAGYELAIDGRGNFWRFKHICLYSIPYS